MRLFTIISFLFFSACSSEPETNHPQLKNVSSDHGFGRGFYTLEGNTVLRYLCPDHAIILNPANCNGGIQRLFLWGVQAYVRKFYGSKLDSYDYEVSQYRIKIDQIDGQMSILLNTEPDHMADLLPQINRVHEQISDSEAVITELRNQQIQIARQLALGEDPDLRLLFDDLEQKLAVKKQQRDMLVQTMLDLRSQYYANNSGILTKATFTRLVNQRALAVRNFDNAQVNLTEQLDEVVAFHTAMKFLKDSETWDFVFTDRDKTAAVVNSVGISFSNYLSPNADRTLSSVWSEDNSHQILANPVVGSRLKQIDISNTDGQAPCSYHIESNRFNVTISYEGSATIARHPPEMDPLFNEVIDGHWIVHEFCARNPGFHARPFRIHYL